MEFLEFVKGYAPFAAAGFGLFVAFSSFTSIGAMRAAAKVVPPNIHAAQRLRSAVASEKTTISGSLLFAIVFMFLGDPILTAAFGFIFLLYAIGHKERAERFRAFARSLEGDDPG